jgi:hypothetical protein
MQIDGLHAFHFCLPYLIKPIKWMEINGYFNNTNCVASNEVKNLKFIQIMSLFPL